MFIQVNDQKLKALFVKKLCEIIKKGDYYCSSISLALLIKIDYINEALSSLDEQLTKKITVPNTLIFIRELLRHEYNLFNDLQLENIKIMVSDKFQPIWTIVNGDYMDNIRIELKNTIISQIEHIRFNNLSKKLDGLNLEINIDKEKTFEKIKYFDFPEILIDALNKIDESYFNPSTDKFDISGNIKLLREFWNKLTDSIANNIKDKTKEEVPKPNPGESLIGNQRRYIKKHLKMSDPEDKLLDAIIDITNKQGGHALISDIESFRLSKNISIEIALLLLNKLKIFNQN